MKTRPRRLAVIMDPIAGINPKKDTTLAILLAAQARGWAMSCGLQRDLFLRDGRAGAALAPVSVRDSTDDWFDLGNPADAWLEDFDAVLMRKDPPFDMEYVYSTYVLERAEQAGALVVNRPAALRDMNEKAYTAWFPQCSPPSLITRSKARLHAFLAEHGHIVVKPLDGMGGRSIFVVARNDVNVNVIFETITADETEQAQALRYIPDIVTGGDQRIIVIDGVAQPYCLARIPADGESRGNLATGARGEGRPLTERDAWIAAQVGPVLRDQGILFAGLDVIGDYLTEINVTSPTGMRELDRQFGLDLGGRLIEAIEAKLDA